MTKLIKKCEVYIKGEFIHAFPLLYYEHLCGLTTSHPIFTISRSSSPSEIGEIVLSALQESKVGVPDNHEYEFSQALFESTGFRSIESFRRKSSCFAINFDEAIISVIPCVGDAYPYKLSKECAANAEDIGRLLLQQAEFMSNDSSEARLLRLGKFFVRDKGVLDDDAWESLKLEGFSIDVPTGKELKLQIASRDKHVDLSSLEAVESKEIHTLDLHMTKLRDRDITYLKGLTSIKALNLQDTNIISNGLEHLKGLIQLLSLNLSFNPLIANPGLVYLKQLPSLHTLMLNGTDVNDEGLAHLQDISTLKRLDLGHLKITRIGLMHLSKLTSLEALDLARTKIKNSYLKSFVNLPSLKNLSVEDTSIGNPGVRHLKRHERLEELNLERTKITNSGLSHLKTFKHLRRLNLADNAITSSSLKHLAKISSLQELDCSRTRVGDRGLSYLKSLPSLKKLCMERTRITDAGLDYLKNIDSLEDLNVKDTRITNSGLIKIKEIRSLRKLSVGIPKRGFFVDRNLREDRWLNKFPREPISSVGFEHIKQMTFLRELAVYNADVAPEEFVDLRRALPNCDLLVPPEWRYSA